MPQNGAGEAPAAPNAQPPQATHGAAPPQAPKPVAPDYQSLHAKAEKELAETRATLKRMEAESAEHQKKEKAREALERERVRNPAKHLESLYGPDWYDVATKAKTGAVSPEVVSRALDEREQGLRAYLDEQLKGLREENAQLKRESLQRTKLDHAREAAAFVKENAAKYPRLNAYKQLDNVGSFIQAHLDSTGEMWTFEQGADAMEKWWEGVRDMVLKCENGRQLSDSLGTTPKPIISTERRAEPVDDAERRRRASEAWQAWAKPRTAPAN